MSKRKIMLVAMTLCMVAILAIGGSLAYLTDTDYQKNTFTSGFVGINLDEANVTLPDGTNNYDDEDNIVGTGTRTEENQKYKLHPNMTVEKDPTITVDADSEDAYIGAIVTIKGDIYDLVFSGEKPGDYDTIAINKLASGGLMDNNEGAYSTKHGMTAFAAADGEYTIYQKADKANKTWVLYVVLEGVYEAEDEIVLFNTLTIPETYNNAEMAKLNNMTIEVKAYATQIDGFADATDALTSAFAEDWADLTK